MSNIVYWRQMVFGASLLFCGAAPLMGAPEIGPVAAGMNASVQQDGRQVTVTVTDKAGPIIGANVLVKGTTIGNITDMDGKAVITGVPDGAILSISYIGYITQEVPLQDNQSTLRVRLVEDTQAIDEVVVVGYGTQAKKDITGSVAVVSTEELKETPVATFAEALQGKASGVYISNSGGPSGETTIRIRGVGSLNGSDPLVVVDGVSNVDIDAVNPNDIESLQVLKDASATAIYGAQGANGVIIITTRQGTKSGRVRVSYDGYVGFSQMANKGYDLLNGWEAMEWQAKGMVNYRDLRNGTPAAHPQFGSLNAQDQLTMPYAIKPAGYSKDQIISQYGSVDAWVDSYLPDGTNSWSRSAYYQMLEDGYSEAEAREGTNWYDMITQKGMIQDHQISLLGGNEKGTYSASIGYTNREGTVINSFFKRYSLRTNSTYIPNKYFSIGQNTNVAVMEMGGERGRQGDDSMFARTYTIQPWVPVYNVGGDFAGSQASEGGRANTAYQGVINSEGDWNRFMRLQSAAFAELKPIEGLSIRTQFSVRLMGGWGVTMNEKTIATNKEGDSQNNLYENANWRLDYQWTNTATYKHTFNEDHDMTLMIGTEAMKFGIGRSMNARRYDYIFERNPNTWELDNGSADNLGNGGSISDRSTMFGLFFRGDYSYKGKYLATFTVRRDASSRFGEKNRWGTFPSVSLGWRISDEAFMEQLKGSWLDDLKIRAGYGTTGNSNIGAYNYAFQYATGNSYLYSITGADSGSSPGYAISNLGDENAKWETTKMFNVGFDATALNNRLTAGFDYYIKKTSDLLVNANWSALAGNASKPKINIGDMENHGVDFSIGWRDKVGDFSYSINANISRYKNEVTKLGSSDLFTNTRLSKVNITTVGQPVAMFYGYQVDGIYQSAEDVMNYKTESGETILPYAVTDLNSLNADAWVGRYKIRDVNGDGKIGAEDRTIIGNPHPDFTGGINISLGWKGFDLSTFLYFSVGNDLYKHYQYYTHFGALQSNFSWDRVNNSWHPTENPNGIYPLWCGTSNEGTEAANESNSTYVEDGSYLRMQTLTLGYTLPKKILDKIKFEKIRIYAQVSNAFTITGYSGLDPEVRSNNGDSSNDMMKGIDYGSYGMPRQFILGVNVSF